MYVYKKYYILDQITCFSSVASEAFQHLLLDHLSRLPITTDTVLVSDGTL